MFHIRRNIKYYNYRPHLIVETNLKFDSKFPHNKTKQNKINIVTRSLSPYLTCVFGAFHYNSPPRTFTLFIARVHHWILEMMFIIIIDIFPPFIQPNSSFQHEAKKKEKEKGHEPSFSMNEWRRTRRDRRSKMPTPPPALLCNKL